MSSLLYRTITQRRIEPVCNRGRDLGSSYQRYVFYNGSLLKVGFPLSYKSLSFLSITDFLTDQVEKVKFILEYQKEI